MLPLAIAVFAAFRSASTTDFSFIEDLSDSFWTYAFLGAAAIAIEELSPIFGGIAANEGELRLWRVIVGVAVGGWICTSLLYLAGLWKWETIRRRLPRLRAAGTVALRVVARNPVTASFLVRFAFGLRIVLPLACGAARVPVAMYLTVSLIGSFVWATIFAVLGYAAGEAAVQVVGKLGRIGEVIGAIVVTTAVVMFIRWNGRRRAQKLERRRRKLQTAAKQ